MRSSDPPPRLLDWRSSVKLSRKGSDSPIAITTLTRTGVVGAAEFTSAHDYTFGVTLNIVIDGANEANFNGTFVITKVPNRLNVQFIMVDAGATVAKELQFHYTAAIEL